MTTTADLLAQAEILEHAAVASPMGTIAGMLGARAKELRQTAKACRHAEDDGYAYELVPAVGLEAGLRIMDPRGGGILTVLRVANRGLGIECEADASFGGDPIVWVNPVSPTSALPVLGARIERADPDDVDEFEAIDDSLGFDLTQP